jgi:hypothetical protein
MKKFFDVASGVLSLSGALMIVIMFTNPWLDLTQFTLAPKFGMGDWDPTRASAVISAVTCGSLLALSALFERFATR